MHNPHDDPGLEAPPASGGSATKPLASGKPGKTRKRRRWRLLLGGGVIYLTVGVYQSCLKPLPQDLSLEGGIYQVADADVEFLHDVTGMQAGQRVSRQMIFDRVLRMIQGAEDFVLVDFFLFNEYQGKDPSTASYAKRLPTLCLKRNGTIPTFA